MDPRRPQVPQRERNVQLRRDAVGALWVASAELLGAEGRLAIVHQGESYQLRRTRQITPILTQWPHSHSGQPAVPPGTASRPSDADPFEAP
jgi:hemin uptake protein HemP